MSNAVVDLVARRRCTDVLGSITLVFGGVHYGTFPLSAPYARGKPLMLYVSATEGDADTGFAGRIDCLLTDDVVLADELESSG